MNHIVSIIKKELQVYFNSPIAYIFLVFFLIVSTLLFFLTFFLVNQADMRGFFSWLPIVFVPFIAAVTMRLWSEEKKQGTLELLLTLPVKDYEVVLGKYLATVIFMLLALVETFTIPAMVSYLGDPDLGVIWTSYLGTLLMASAFIALGLAVSAYTSNQIIAWIVSTALGFVFLIVGYPFFLNFVPRFLVPFLEYLGFGTHFDSFSRGVIDSRDVIYYLTVIAFFLFLNIRKLESRKYS